MNEILNLIYSTKTFSIQLNDSNSIVATMMDFLHKEPHTTTANNNAFFGQGFYLCFLERLTVCNESFNNNKTAINMSKFILKN